MTLKDKFLKMLIQAIIYKKIILWMDLDIWSDGIFEIQLFKH